MHADDDVLHSHWDVLLIDGHSGSGKTSLAQCVATERGAQILSLEHLYPGWNGLAEGSEAVARVLAAGRYRPYDWHAGRFAVTSTHLVRGQPLIIEGCGALTQSNLEASRAWASAQPARGGELDPIDESDDDTKVVPLVRSVWLELEAPERRRRALERDGAEFAQHWEMWAEQERAFFARHRPWALASAMVTAQ